MALSMRASPGEILVSERTARLLQGQFDLIEAGEIRILGQRIDTFVLEGPVHNDHASSVPGSGCQKKENPFCKESVQEDLSQEFSRRYVKPVKIFDEIQPFSFQGSVLEDRQKEIGRLLSEVRGGESRQGKARMGGKGEEVSENGHGSSFVVEGEGAGIVSQPGISFLPSEPLG